MSVCVLPDVRQDVDSGGTGVQLPPAVVGDPDSGEARLQGSHSVLRPADALDSPGTLPLLTQPLSVLPTVKLSPLGTVHISG